jgi:hypothetical protein
MGRCKATIKIGEATLYCVIEKPHEEAEHLFYFRGKDAAELSRLQAIEQAAREYMDAANALVVSSNPASSYDAMNRGKVAYDALAAALNQEKG